MDKFDKTAVVDLGISGVTVELVNEDIAAGMYKEYVTIAHGGSGIRADVLYGDDSQVLLNCTRQEIAIRENMDHSSIIREISPCGIIINIEYSEETGSDEWDGVLIAHGRYKATPALRKVTGVRYIVPFEIKAQFYPNREDVLCPSMDGGPFLQWPAYSHLVSKMENNDA